MIVKITEDWVYPSSVMLQGEPISRGQSLRDRFAEVALREIMKSGGVGGRCNVEATLAYQYADAMLKARSK